MLKNKIITITGGTGSFGKKIIPELLKTYKPKEIRVFSRDEMKQWHLQEKYAKQKIIKFIIGDVRDSESLRRSIKGSDYVIHAAATKIVPTAEYNPSECIKTNVFGAMNVINECISSKVKKVISLSTDKACNPANLYGATKLCSDKLFVAANFLENNTDTKFSVVRYGNVMGSRGSVIPFFLNQKNTGIFTITDKEMTRFMITLKEATDLVKYAFSDMNGGEIYISKIPSMKIADIATAIKPNNKIKITGVRPGEKMHEIMISKEDSFYTYEYKKYYKILPSLNSVYKKKSYIKNGIKVQKNFEYSSDTNTKWMTKKNLDRWLSDYIKSEDFNKI
jgi:UDP-N-acetylglucosamine 4,6-dehydratase